MTDDTPPRDRARQERLRAALRENLKRRKFQARERAQDAASDAPASGVDGRQATPEGPDEA